MLLLIQKSVGPLEAGLNRKYASREVEAPLKHVNIRAV
jgi:hypothetical protein